MAVELSLSVFSMYENCPMGWPKPSTLAYVWLVAGAWSMVCWPFSTLRYATPDIAKMSLTVTEKLLRGEEDGPEDELSKVRSNRAGYISRCIEVAVETFLKSSHQTGW